MFTYCLVNRPFMIGAQPKAGFIKTEPRPSEDDDLYQVARHGFAIYDRKLTHEEEKSFELAPVLSKEDLDDLAAQVANSYTKYRDAIIEMVANKEREWVANNFFEKARRLYPGYSPALPEYFPQLVYHKLVS